MLLRGQLRVDYLGRSESRAQFYFSSDFHQHMLKRADDGDGVQIVVKAKVGDAEKLPFHLALPVGDDCAETAAQFFGNLAGVDPIRRSYGRERSTGRAFGEEFKSQGLHGSASHGGCFFSIANQQVASGGQITAALLPKKIQGRGERGDQRGGWRIRRFSLGAVLALFAQIKIVTRVLAV